MNQIRRARCGISFCCIGNRCPENVCLTNSQRKREKCVSSGRTCYALNTFHCILFFTFKRGQDKALGAIKVGQFDPLDFLLVGKFKLQVVSRPVKGEKVFSSSPLVHIFYF